MRALLCIIKITFILFGLSYMQSLEFAITRVSYFNPKYISEASFTNTKKDNKTPTVDLNITTLQPWSYNITEKVTFQNMKDKTVASFKFNLCNTFKLRWWLEYSAKFANKPLDRCPLPAGAYNWHNIELPPKNLPFMFPLDVDYKVDLEIYMTKSREKICNIFMLLRTARKSIRKLKFK